MTVLVWLIYNLLQFHDFIQSVASIHLLEPTNPVWCLIKFEKLFRKKNATWPNTYSLFIMTALFCFLSEPFLICYRPTPSIYLAFCKSYILLMTFICALIRPDLSERKMPDANVNRVLLHYRSFRCHVIRSENCIALDAVTINFFSLSPVACSNSILTYEKLRIF
jgi:hypothetical protein